MKKEDIIKELLDSCDIRYRVIGHGYIDVFFRTYQDNFSMEADLELLPNPPNREPFALNESQIRIDKVPVYKTILIDLSEPSSFEKIAAILNGSFDWEINGILWPHLFHRQWKNPI